MITKARQLADSEAELFVELDEDELKDYLKKAGEKLSGLIAIDGFRAGKVPLDVLRKKIGDQKVLEEALEFAVADSLAKALKKEKLEIISSSDLKISENTSENLKYSIHLLLMPQVKLGEYKNLGISQNKVIVEAKEIDDALGYILKSKAKYQDFDGPAQKDNHLEIDFEVSADGKLIEGGKSENHPFILGKGSFIPGFEDQLVNLSKGETKSFSLEAPRDYYQKAIAGKKLDFKVTVKSIKKVTLPQLDDEFAKSLGGFESLDSLKKRVSESIKLEKEQKERDKAHLQILEKIDKGSEINLPAKLVEQRLDTMISNFDHSLHERGMELGLYLAHVKKSQDDLRKEWRKQAEKQLRRGLIMREIGRKEKIEVSDEEAGEATQNLMAEYLALDKQSEDILDPGRLKEQAGDALWHDKVFEYLEKQNLIN